MTYLKPGDKVILTPYGLNLTQHICSYVDPKTTYTLNFNPSSENFYITLINDQQIEIELEEDPNSEYNIIEKVIDTAFDSPKGLSLKPRVTVDFYKEDELVILLSQDRNIKIKVFSSVADDEHGSCFMFKYTRHNIKELNSLFQLDIPLPKTPSEIIEKLFENNKVVLAKNIETSNYVGLTKYSTWNDNLVPIDSITGEEILFLQ